MEQQVAIEAVKCNACGNINKGDYCAACGEYLHPKRFSTATILTTLPDLFFDVDRGLLYTVREMFRNPGKTISSYLKGDRGRHYNPLKFVLFMSGLYALLYMSFNIHGTSGDLTYSDVTSKENAVMLEQEYIQCQSIINLVALPFFSFLSWLFFMNKKLYYGEHLLINSFIVGCVMFINNLFFPIMLLKNGTEWVDWMENIIALLTFVLPAWTYYGLFYERSGKNLLIASAKTVGIVLILLVWYFITTPVVILLKKAIAGD